MLKLNPDQTTPYYNNIGVSKSSKKIPDRSSAKYKHDHVKTIEFQRITYISDSQTMFLKVTLRTHR